MLLLDQVQFGRVSVIGVEAVSCHLPVVILNLRLVVFIFEEQVIKLALLLVIL